MSSISETAERVMAQLVESCATEPGVAEAFGLTYPTELDRLVGGHLEHLIDAQG